MTESQVGPPPSSPSASVRDDGDAAVFTTGHGELARYVYRPQTDRLESPKPYLHPIRTRAGRVVSLFRPHDHVWHTGIAWSLPNVGEHNFWGGPTFTRDAGAYAQLPNNGSQDHSDVTALGAADGRAVFSHDLEWHAQSGAQVFTERRTLSVELLDDSAWALGWETIMTNATAEEIRIGSPTTEGRENAGYGGLFWRAPRSFDHGTVIAPSGEHDAEELRGTRHDWLAFVGRHDGDGSSSTVVVVDPGGNPGGQPRWFVRSDIYGCVNPAPFFSEEVPALPGVPLSFGYSVVVADGASDLERAARLARAGASTRRGAEASTGAGR